MITFAIGDIHGCLDKLTRLVQRCRRRAGERETRFVLLGDYVDRGPDSRGVIAFVRELQRAGEIIALRGNHEAMMLDAARTGEHLLWLFNGAAQTLASYRAEAASDLPEEDLAWLDALPRFFDDGRRYFVHAGINPAVPLVEQGERDQLWIREPFLSDERSYARLIVHGHTPVRNGRPDVRANRVNVDTGAVFGGPLTAALFDDETVQPVLFLTSD